MKNSSNQTIKEIWLCGLKEPVKMCG